jgi:hypothetical protein
MFPYSTLGDLTLTLTQLIVELAIATLLIAIMSHLGRLRSLSARPILIS